jgi:hypothetical protein
MPETKEQILQMLEDGAITAEEANRLMAAIEESEAASRAEAMAPPSDAPPIPADLPHVSDFRDNWQVPFIGALIGLAVTGRKLVRARRKEGFFARLATPFYWLGFFAAGAVGLLSLWSRDARWLYLDIETEDGNTVKLTLPVPVQMLTWILSRVQPLADGEDAAQLGAVLDFFNAMQDQFDSPEGDPIFLDINDEGNRVKIYFV